MTDSSAPHVAGGAHIAEGARLGQGVRVGANVVIEDDVEVGAGTELLPGTILHAGARVGAGCRIGPYAVVGGEPMDHKFRGEPSYAVLEDGVTVREFATVHRATGEGLETRVGAGTLVMAYVHVSHNTVIGEKCVLTAAAQLGGHVEVGHHAVIGGGTLMHQFGRVGAYAMFGAASAANQDVLPFTMASGRPAVHYRLNRVGLERNGITGERYKVLERCFRLLRRRDMDGLAQLAHDNEDARLLQQFVLTSKRGVCRFLGR